MTDISEREKIARIIHPGAWFPPPGLDVLQSGKTQEQIDAEVKYSQDTALMTADRLIAAGYKSMPVDQGLIYGLGFVEVELDKRGRGYAASGDTVMADNYFRYVKRVSKAIKALTGGK